MDMELLIKKNIVNGNVIDKIFKYITVLLVAISFSCDDSFSPNSPIDNEYALYCILNADSTTQIAFLSHSYRVDGFDLYQNKTDPSLEGADIKLTVNGGDVYKFIETSSERIDTTRYKTRLKYYLLDDIQLKDNDMVEITADLKNGRVLKSTSNVPPISQLYFEKVTTEYFYQIINHKIVDIEFTWVVFGSPSRFPVKYFLPQLEIIYSKADNPNRLLRVKVPKLYTSNNSIPVYPLPTNEKRAYFYYESVVKTLETISHGDPQKNNYIIHDAEFMLSYMDKYIASYSSAATTFRDEFSLRIDAADYSNIQDGLGLFGIYASKKSKIHLADLFVKSFGYRPADD